MYRSIDVGSFRWVYEAGRWGLKRWKTTDNVALTNDEWVGRDAQVVEGEKSVGFAAIGPVAWESGGDSEGKEKRCEENFH